MIPRFVPGLGAAILVAAGAHRARWLSSGGAVAAIVLGTITVAAGWTWGALLIVFFLTTSAVSRFRAAEKNSRGGDIIAKGSKRDARQVVANGGLFGIAAVGFAASGGSMWLAAAGGALATAAADSWATEIGMLSRAPPRLIVSGRPVAPGTSGGVTVAGVFGALAGATTIAAAMLLFQWSPPAAGAAFLAGITGMFLDSLLGATVQARMLCPRCNRETERAVHGCGTATQFRRGVRWIDNDAVNALATLAGGLIAVPLFHGFG